MTDNLSDQTEIDLLALTLDMLRKAAKEGRLQDMDLELRHPVKKSGIDNGCVTYEPTGVFVLTCVAIIEPESKK